MPNTVTYTGPADRYYITHEDTRIYFPRGVEVEVPDDVHQRLREHPKFQTTGAGQGDEAGDTAGDPAQQPAGDTAGDPGHQPAGGAGRAAGKATTGKEK